MNKNTLRPTIFDVAKKVKVSPAMVSRVLTGRGYVKKTKKELIQKTIEKMQFYPSAIAQNLRKQKTLTLGLYLCWPYSSVNFFLQNILIGILDGCTATKYQLLVTNLGERLDQLSPINRHKFFNDTRVDGILLLAPYLQQSKLYPILQPYMQRVMLVCAQNKYLNFVDSDQVHGIYQVVEFLVQQGYRRIGFLSGEISLVSNADTRFRGFKQAIKKFNLPWNASLRWKGSFNFNSGKEGASYLLGLKNPPTALIASNDALAAGAQEILKLKHLEKKIPLIGVDDHPLAGSRGLSTLKQPFQEIGRQSVFELIQLLQSSNQPLIHHLLPMELIHRETSLF
jgi:LacI family transcriptional regulator